MTYAGKSECRTSERITAVVTSLGDRRIGGVVSDLLLRIREGFAGDIPVVRGLLTCDYAALVERNK